MMGLTGRCEARHDMIYARCSVPVEAGSLVKALPGSWETLKCQNIPYSSRFLPVHCNQHANCNISRGRRSSCHRKSILDHLAAAYPEAGAISSLSPVLTSRVFDAVGTLTAEDPQYEDITTISGFHNGSNLSNSESED